MNCVCGHPEPSHADDIGCTTYQLDDGTDGPADDSCLGTDQPFYYYDEDDDL